MKIIRFSLLLILLLSISGCATNWHCESDFSAIEGICASAQTSLMKSIPLKCRNGGDVTGKLIATKKDPKGFTRYRSEAAIQCENQ